MQIASRKLDWLDPVNGDFCGSKTIPAMEKNTLTFLEIEFVRELMYCKIIPQTKSRNLKQNKTKKTNESVHRSFSLKKKKKD